MLWGIANATLERLSVLAEGISSAAEAFSRTFAFAFSFVAEEVKEFFAFGGGAAGELEVISSVEEWLIRPAG